MSFFKKIHDRVTAPQATVELKFNSCSVPLGGNLEGTLNVASKEDFDSNEVRVEIQCIEQAKVIKQEYNPAMKCYVPREVEESCVLYATKPVLSNATHFNNGETRTFPINVNIPAGGRPTYQGIQRVIWTLKGVLAVEGRPDCTSHASEIQVLQQAAQPVIVQKEVVREIVRIPCRFCGTLYDQLDISCPNCGAKRTA